jgi:4-cresol dehydrogenase (hydroxylating)
MALPSDVSTQAFAAAISKWQSIVGKDWVFTSDEDVALYRDSYSPLAGEPDERVASAAVAPASAEEVQKIVHVANMYKIPLYPISTGKNLGYGGSAPVLSGSVVLDLKRMSRISDYDETNGTVLVEPGVNYFDLYRFLQERGGKYWIDCPDPGWGSVIGNALDHGAGYTAGDHRNHFDSHCGMEVVLPTGEILRTGMGAMANAKTWQQYKYGIGPYVAGLFGQSNYGVVTKMGFWLYPQPDAYFRGIVTVPKRADLAPLIKTVNRLENLGVVNGMIGFRSPLAADLRKPALLSLIDKPGGWIDAELDRYAADNNLPNWSCSLAFFGPKEVVASQWKYAKECFSEIPGVDFRDDETVSFPLTTERLDELKKNETQANRNVEFGIPSLSIFSIGARSATNPNPTDGHVWFSPIIPRNAEALMEAERVFYQASKEAGLPPTSPFSGPATCWHRSFVFIMGFPIYKDPEVNKKSREAFRKMVKVAAEHGWGEYRTHAIYYDDIADTYSFNNHALRRFQEVIKDAIDPNGILSAGRYGIWPKHLRNKRS